MRFLMLNWRDPKNPSSGGAERVTEAYWMALRDRGHEVVWYANAFPGCVHEENVRGIQIVRGGGSGKSVFLAREWYRRQRPFDLVVDQHHGIPWFAPWWAGTACVAYLHEVLGPIWDSFYRWPLNSIGRAQEQFMHRVYRRIPFWVGSESTRQALLRSGVKDVTVIHYGIDLQVLENLEPKPLKPPLRLITVSRLAPNKRIDHAIRATRLLLDRGVDVTLTVVGGGVIESLLRESARDLVTAGKVVFAGILSEAEKDRRLRDSHLLIHTSLREGWGLNVLEANAMGTPAVVYPVAGLVDATLHGKTGWVTASETPDSVADSVMALLESPGDYDRFRQAARDRTREFHWSQVLPGACDWLEAQASEGRRR